nr:protein kinase-like domain, concanavalin A-like lectin/glucanase domain protein [Tanacetum cinerariifolium]
MRYLFDPTPSDWCKRDAHSTDFDPRIQTNTSMISKNFWIHMTLMVKIKKERSITTWEDLTTYFFAQLFPPGRTAKLRNDILMFKQHHGESLSEAWTRFKDLLQKVPHPGQGNFLPQNVPSTSDHRLTELENQVQCLMEAHVAPIQPTQWNKITSSCEICSGPHNTQYCMKNLEQDFVEYASSRTDEAGGPSGNAEEIEWLDVEELLDLFDTSKESVYESLIMEMPKCSLNYDFRIKKGDPRNLKIPCMIGLKFTANAYIDVDIPMRIMSLAYFNSINKNGYEYRGRNFIGLRRDMHIFVGNMSYVVHFTILENIETNIAPSLSQVVFGRPFVEIACFVINRKHGLMTFTDGIKEITFKTPIKDPERSDLSSEGHDLLSSRIILSEDDYDRGCRKPSDLEDRFYKDISKLGLEYVTGMDDDEEVTLYLMRRSLKVLRKFHWMILGGRFNQLSHVSSPLLRKPGEY